ncbi:A/G-specific adenine glycosylase [Botrimarina sp.]|uniref:A/G-specific adenine glycosylase n=1 Tax=Botrimarina sp. TaxID=2795802 RepID=UPI0032EE0E39
MTRVASGEPPAPLPAPLPADYKSRLRRRLLAWYGRSARDLPWRRTRDPYRVWVSEVMLQQTQVDTVRPYFERFVEAFPTVADLAAADEEHVLRLWEGLGYYRRARSLHAAAKQVVAEHGGRMPREVAGLMTLPGIGRYTAGAVVSIAYDRPAPILEANTIRLLTRLVAYDGEPTSAAGQRRLWALAEELLPHKGAARFNQALMELGALVCKPAEPLCGECPLEPLCRARAEGSIGRLGATTKKLRFTDTREAAVVVRRGPSVLVRRCGEGERWAGLWDFPRFAIDAEGPLFAAKELAGKVLQQTGVRCEPGALITTLKHGVTRFRITLDCYEAAAAGGRVRKPARWVRPSELADLPLSVTGRKLSKLIL